MSLDRRRKAAERAVLVEEALSVLRHDLRNKHGTIRNAVYFLQRKLKDSDEPRVQQFLSLILIALNQAEESMVDVKPEGVDYQRVLVPTDLLDCMRAIMRLSDRKDISLRAEPAELFLDTGEMAAAFMLIFEHAGDRAVSIVGAYGNDEYTLRFSFASQPTDQALQLKTVGRIATKNNGFLNVEVVGKTTTVTLRLPLPPHRN